MTGRGRRRPATARSRHRPGAARTLARRLGVAAAATALAGACGESVPLDPAAAAGRHVYQSVCIACHNADPTLPGSLGPPIAGASRELLAAKILRGEYPPGYSPKRDTHAMPRLAHLADQIDEIAAYLNAMAARSSASRAEPAS